MKFMLFVLPTVPASLEDRKRLRPIGRNTERYQQMLDEVRKLAVFADEAGGNYAKRTLPVRCNRVRGQGRTRRRGALQLPRLSAPERRRSHDRRHVRRALEEHHDRIRSRRQRRVRHADLVDARHVRRAHLLEEPERPHG